jgi:hypothetical protein
MTTGFKKISLQLPYWFCKVCRIVKSEFECHGTAGEKHCWTHDSSNQAAMTLRGPSITEEKADVVLFDKADELIHKFDGKIQRHHSRQKNHVKCLYSCIQCLVSILRDDVFIMHHQGQAVVNNVACYSPRNSKLRLSQTRLRSPLTRSWASFIDISSL